MATAYNNEFYYNEALGDDVIILPEQIKMYKERVEKIFKFLDTTDDKTQYYKVLHKKNKDLLIGDNKRLGAELAKRFKYFVFIGMGGAILNPMMVRSFCGNVNLLNNTFFINSTDPLLIKSMLIKVKLEETCFIPISNSGETTETYTVAKFLIKKMRDEKIPNFHEHFVFITANESSRLYKMAAEHSIKTVPYDPDVGGRFSTFSNSAILPAAIMGLDLDGYLDGANSIVDEFWKNRENSRSARAALNMLLSKKRVIALYTYYSELRPFTEWYAQIISESLGKNKVGYVPFYGVCPMEQHTSYQYFLDGGNDSLITMIYGENHSDIKDSDYAELNEVNDKFFKASVEFMQNQQIPVRTIELKSYDAYSFGALLMHCTIEIVFLSLLHEFHPFDQPAMDECKKFALNKYFA
ncbi:MAG: hypothetical protein LW826_03170 [Candidatus Jidaibacter sp.]|nr:hypothetical protein [Candidatus Jidaibacter sp.]